MKLETLRNYFNQRVKTKLYITMDEFLVAGHASSPRQEGEELVLTVCPYVVYAFAQQEILERANLFPAIRLSPNSRFTRRLETHRRHQRGKAIPNAYFKKAWEI